MNDSFTCELCGKELLSMGCHLKAVHGIDVGQYRHLFPGSPTVSASVSRRLSENGRTINKGRKFTAIHKRRISEAHKKIDHPWVRGPKVERVQVQCPQCGKVRARRPCDAETYSDFCSLDCWYDYIREDPSRHPNWNGGISREPYSFDFNDELKASVRARDGCRCQLCGVPQSKASKDGRALAVHHIDYDKANASPDNLISLCVRCSSKVNFNRDHWTAYFQELLLDRGVRFEEVQDENCSH